MKRTIAAACVAALLAGAVVAVGQGGNSDETSRCIVPGARTVVANSDVRVYSREKAARNDSQATGLYACRYSTGKRIALGTAYVPLSDEPGDSAPVRFIRDISLSDEAGGTTPRVAFVDTNCVNRDPCVVDVVVKSLGTGRTERRLKAGSPFDILELSVPTDQDGIAIAWLETSSGGACTGGCRVHLVKESGDKVLDEGTDIDSDLFGTVSNDRPGVIHTTGTNEFVWKRGETVKVASYND